MKGPAKFATRSIWLHLSFWIASFYAIGSYFSISNEISTIDIVYAAFFHIPLFILVYTNLRYLVPHFLEKSKYLIYIFLGSINLALAYFIHELIFEIVIPVLPTDYYMVSFTDLWVLIRIFSIYLILSTLLRLSNSWIKLQRREQERLKFELNSLKMQLNPHFLFNSLNSLYSLALKKSETTPAMVLGLSNLLRYMLYEVSEDLVLFDKEIDGISQYIELQKLRTEHAQSVGLTIEGDTGDIKIAPLLLFPLVENCFKHGRIDKEEETIQIKITAAKDQITFRATNQKGQIDKVEEKHVGGIGLQNVRKRLDILYGNRANLEINDHKERFEVNLSIKL